MCIALFSTAHPEYPFILLNNRDEFLSRPTLNADWWEEPNTHVLGGRDTERQERGTWLGITKQGRIAILTNFREEGAEVTRSKSRGALPKAYLTAPPDEQTDSEAFAAKLINEVGINDVGGFSLLFGDLRGPNSEGRRLGLSVLSNRSESAQDLKHIATTAGQTYGLSNSHFGDTSWPKVVRGEKLLDLSINADASPSHHGYAMETTSRDHFIASLFDILSMDTLRQREPGEDWDVYVRQMRNSILIPPVKGHTPSSGSATPDIKPPVEAELRAGVHGNATPRQSESVVEGAGYGTQKQTVVLVDRGGHVTFVERTLFDNLGRRMDEGDAERKFEFDIERWES